MLSGADGSTRAAELLNSPVDFLEREFEKPRRIVSMGGLVAALRIARMPEPSMRRRLVLKQLSQQNRLSLVFNTQADFMASPGYLRPLRESHSLCIVPCFRLELARMGFRRRISRAG